MRFDRLPLVRAALAAGLALSGAAGLSADDKGIDWRTDYNTARKEAVEKGLPLLLEFVSEECIHCKRLEGSTFKDEKLVGLVNARFVPLRIDGNRSPKLVQDLRIQAYPTMIFAGTDGKIYAIIEGFMEAGRLTTHAKKALAPGTPEWMPRDLDDATKALAAGDPAKAVVLLKGIVKDNKDLPIQDQAAQALVEVEKTAAGRLARVKQLQEKGESPDVAEALKDLALKYAGTATAADAAKMLAKLADKPEPVKPEPMKPELTKEERARLAADLLAQARDAFKAERFHEALEKGEAVEAAYKDLPEGTWGSQLVESIRTSPERLRGRPKF